MVESPTLFYVGGQDSGTGTSFVYSVANVAGVWTWTDISDAGGSGPHTGVEAMALDTNNNLIVGTTGGVWLYSPVAGTWTDLNGNLSSAEVAGVATNSTNPDDALADSTDIGLSQYSGAQSWAAVDPTVAPAVTFSGQVQFDPNNPNVAYAVVGQKLIYSTNANTPGATWASAGIVGPGAGPELIFTVSNLEGRRQHHGARSRRFLQFPRTL